MHEKINEVSALMIMRIMVGTVFASAIGVAVDVMVQSRAEAVMTVQTHGIS
jgi:hypothetical protein